MRVPAALTNARERVTAGLRWPTPREFRYGVAVAVPIAVMSGFVLRGCNSADVPHLTAPAGVTLPAGAPTTTAPGNSFAGVVLPPVDGTTTVVPLPTTGTSRVTGVVVGPQGAVAGAFVHLERTAPGRNKLVFDVGTGPDGRYDVSGAPGGRYRVWAYLPPTLAQTESVTFFLAKDESRETNLTVEAFGGLTVQVAVAPVPPLVNQPLNLVVQVTTRQVDGGGVVRAMPVVGAGVQLTSSGQWQGLVPQPSAVTNGEGEVTFALTCRTAGPNSVQVTVHPSAVDPPTTQTFDVGTCEPPPPTTTTTTTSSTAPTSSTLPQPNSTP